MQLINRINQWCEDFEIARDGKPSAKNITDAINFLFEEIRETDRASGGDEMELLDGFADVAFVAINGIYKVLRFMGMSPDEATMLTDEVLNRVTVANDTKRFEDGKPRWDEKGKVMKPEGFKPPSYDDFYKAAF